MFKEKLYQSMLDELLNEISAAHLDCKQLQCIKERIENERKQNAVKLLNARIDYVNCQYNDNYDLAFYVQDNIKLYATKQKIYDIALSEITFVLQTNMYIF